MHTKKRNSPKKPPLPPHTQTHKQTKKATFPRNFLIRRTYLVLWVNRRPLIRYLRGWPPWHSPVRKRGVGSGQIRPEGRKGLLKFARREGFLLSLKKIDGSIVLGGLLDYRKKEGKSSQIGPRSNKARERRKVYVLMWGERFRLFMSSKKKTGRSKGVRKGGEENKQAKELQIRKKPADKLRSQGIGPTSGLQTRKRGSEERGSKADPRRSGRKSVTTVIWEHPPAGLRSEQ